MSDYQRNYSGYSGFPIDPAPGGDAPQQGESDAERTAYLPPIPAAPQGYPSAGADETALLPPIPTHPGDPSAAQAVQTGQATQSRFGHIEAKYGTSEFPQSAAPLDGLSEAPAPQEPPSGQSPWPAGWERPAAPPRTWAPAGQSPGSAQPPYPAPADPPSQQPWAAHAPSAPDDGAPQPAPFASAQPAGAGAGAYPGGAPAAHAQPQTRPAGAHSLREPFASAQPPYAATDRGPAEGFAPGQSPQFGGPAHGGGLAGGPPPSGAPGPGQGFAPGQAPLGGPGGAGAGSLRETFAAAQPTGPGRGAPEGVYVGAVLAPGQSPLEFGGGSLREAFADAQPTGPVTAPPAPAGVAAPRARTGSPIIDPGVQPAAITLVLGALIGVAALAGKFGLVVPVALLQAVTAAGWFRLNGMWPARQGIALAALGGFVADAAILAASAHSSGPAILAGTLGAFFLLVLILQIFRPSNPDERFYALTVCASATVATVLAGGFLAVGSGKAVLAGALAAGVSAAVSSALRRPAAIGFAAGGVVGLLTGAGLAAATGLGMSEGLLLGLGAAGCALIGRRVAAYDFPSRFVHMTAGVALPLALAAPVVYLIAR